MQTNLRPTPRFAKYIYIRKITLLGDVMLDTLIYWLYILLVLGIAFILGFAITTLFKNLNIAEKLAISFGFSFLIIILLTPLFALKLDTLARFIFVLIAVASLYYLLKQKQDLKLSNDFLFLSLVLIISLVSRFFIQTLWDYPVIGGDWYGHTLIRPYMFNIGDWTPPQERTPLFNLLIYSYHHLLGTSLYQYWISQIISVVANTVFILPAYLIAKKVFDENIAKVSAAFMIITPFLVKNAIYTWPKNMAMYFTLLMIYFMFFRAKPNNNKLNYGLAGFFAALGFLTHNYVLFYIFTALIAFAYVKKLYDYKQPLASLHELFENKFIYFFLALIAITIPYFLWVYSSYGTISTSQEFIYYPFAVEGYWSIDNPQKVFETFFNTPISHIIGIRIFNAIVTLTPAALPINPVATNYPSYNPIYYYSHDYPGALSTLMYFLVLLWFLRYLMGKTNTDRILGMLVVIPMVLYLILYGWIEWGLLTGGLHPSFPILIMLGFNELYKITNQRIKSTMIYLVFVGCLVEDFIYGILTLNFYHNEGGLSSVSRSISNYIPDFQISNFVSAHFLLSGSDLLLNSIISSGIIVLAILGYLRLSRREKINSLYP